MRADPLGGRTVEAPAPLNAAAFCRLLEHQRFPDLGFLEIVAASEAPWNDPNYRVHLTLRHQVTREPVRKTIIVRAIGDASETVFRSARELWARIFCCSDTLSMGMPLGFVPERGLFVQCLPEGPTLLDLMRDRRESQLTAGIRTLARWLAKLHDTQQGCEALPIRLDSDLRQELHDAHGIIASRLPQHRQQITAIADSLHRSLAMTPNPLLPTLGAVHLDQIHFHNEVLAPVNFTKTGLGDPAADLGMTCAAIEQAVLQVQGVPASQGAMDRLLETFSSEYRRHGGTEPFNRVKQYMAFAYVLHVAEAIKRVPVDSQWARARIDRAAALV
ncbi:MAG: phosphotransferase [Candidatus Sericytochromatia bacterium]|nr:phosphotransferase [Candidatus Sericytochromatia bacterium]